MIDVQYRMIGAHCAVWVCVGRTAVYAHEKSCSPSDFGFLDDRLIRLYTVFQVDSAWSQRPSQACWAILPDDPPAGVTPASPTFPNY